MKGICTKPEKFFKMVTTPALPANSMKGKTALVTGGGTGIGKGIATMFARLGANVAIASRRMDVLEKTAAEIRTETGGVCEPFKLDVKDPALIAQSFDEVEKKFGLPNVLVNNAAGNFVMATNRLSANAVKTVIDIVLVGTINTTNELVRRAMEKGEGANVLSISTPYARHGSPFVVPSACAKAGVENMTRSLASEFAKFGFRFNALALGPVPTEGAFGRLAAIPMDEAVRRAAATVPEGRCADTAEVANVVSFICSDYGSWFNGAIIDFDGGQQFHNHGSNIAGPEGHKMSMEQWGQIEEMIRGRTGKKK